MKYMKRAKIYQCSNYNCKFSAEKLEAWSYHWWSFVKVIEGKLVFNNYRYSNSTSKHQSKVRSLMFQLGIEADIALPIPEGLQTCSSLEELYLKAEEYLCNQFLRDELKREERNERARIRRAEQREKERQRIEQVPHLTLC